MKNDKEEKDILSKNAVNKGLISEEEEQQKWESEGILSPSFDDMPIDMYTLATLIAKRARELNETDGIGSLVEVKNSRDSYIWEAVNEVKKNKITYARKRKKGAI